MSTETIEILLATYNGEAYVRQQIESIQAQTHSDWRLLVSDDCSSDGTVAVVEEMAAADSRLTLVGGARHGSAQANFRYLLKQATAEHVMFCDQDDVWLPRKIEVTLAKMREVEGQAGADVPCLVFTDMKVVDEDLNVLSESMFAHTRTDPTRTSLVQLNATGVGSGCTMMLNSPLVQLVNKADGTTCVVSHDWWSLFVAAAFGKIDYVPEPMSLYRQHSSNVVGANKYKALKKVTSTWEHRAESERGRLNQAQAFLETYDQELNLTDKEALTHFVQSYTADTFLARFYHLVRSGGWRTGLRRKLAQFEIVIRWKEPSASCTMEASE